ncbi:flagellar basal body-associated protein FliL, partial [Bradyrhizobium guangdongense]
MAENEEGAAAADGAEAAPPKNKLKLIIMVVGVLAVLGG